MGRNRAPARPGVGPRTRRRPIAVLDLPWVLINSRRHPMHVAGLIVLEAPADAGPDFAQGLMRHMAQFSEASDPFDRRLHRRGWGRVWPRWAAVPSVDLDHHVRLSSLAAPGDDRELRNHVAALHRESLDLRKPLWEVHVIEGLDGGRFAIYAKFHHSLLDGVGAMRVLQSAFSTDPLARDTPPVWAYHPPARVRSVRRRRRRDRATVLPRAVRAAAAHHLNRGPAGPYSAPRSILNTAVSSERIVSTHSYDLSRLRGLASAMGGTLNDAYLAVCAAAVRSYLLGIDELPSRSLVAALPVSVRPSDGEATGNAITFAFVPLSTEIDDVVERAARIVSETARAKARLSLLAKDVMNTYTVVTMTPFITSQLVGLAAGVAPMFNVAVSNITGPPQPLFYNGCPIQQIFPISLLQSGQALNITALSYVDQINVTFTACPAYLPDTDRLPGYSDAALAELELAFGITN